MRLSAAWFKPLIQYCICQFMHKCSHGFQGAPGNIWINKMLRFQIMQIPTFVNTVGLDFLTGLCIAERLGRR